MRRVLVAIAAVLLVGGVAVWIGSLGRSRRQSPVEVQPLDRPVEVLVDGYVSSRECRTCHLQQHESWQASYHRTMTQPATPETILGDFGDVTLEDDGRTYRLFRRGEGYYVELDSREASVRGPQPAASDAAARITRRIVLVTGSHHMQVYWYATGADRTLGQLPFVFLLPEARWIPRAAAFLTPPEKPFHPETGRWNSSCARCHTTHPRRRPIAEGHSWDTHVAEFGISCEACHGPGAEHVAAMREGSARTRNVPQRRPAMTPPDVPAPAEPRPGSEREQRAGARIINPRHLSPERASHVCGQCHGFYLFAYRRLEDREVELQQGFRYRPGGHLQHDCYRFLVDYTPFTRQPVVEDQLRRDPHFIADRFWPDGMVRVSGREFTAMLKTPCVKAGEMSCLSCHDMHRSLDDPRPLSEWADDQLRPGPADAACLECHRSFRTGLVEHTHHAPHSSGSRCVNCHMPHTTYGLLKAIRSHHIDSPDLSAARAAGRPNACNLCHLDRPLAWTAERLRQWYNRPSPALEADEELLAAGVLWSLTGDAGVRALSAWSMGWPPAQEASGTGWMAPVLAVQLTDPYEAVRLIALRSLKQIPPFAASQYEVLASAADRLAAREDVLERWRQQPPVEHRWRNAATLIDADGNVQSDRLLGLWERRDDRRIDLQE